MEITEESHLDHGLAPDVVEHIRDRFADRASFFVESFELPPRLGLVYCDLYGPAMGDAPVVPGGPVTYGRVAYLHRGSRPYPSRVLIGAPRRPTRTVTVIAGPHGDSPCVLYTAFGGPSTPREPGDPALNACDADTIAAAEAFWAKHALVAPAGAGR